MSFEESSRFEESISCATSCNNLIFDVIENDTVKALVKCDGELCNMSLFKVPVRLEVGYRYSALGYVSRKGLGIPDIRLYSTDVAFICESPKVELSECDYDGKNKRSWKTFIG